MNLAEIRRKMVYYLFSPHLEKTEKILHVAHRHPFLLLKGALINGFFHSFLPIFFWYVFPEAWYVFTVWLIYGFIAMNLMVFNWYFDSILVTSMSLIDVKWNGPFDRSSVRLEYQMIEGTTYVFKGILQTVFNYGLIQISRQGGVVGISLDDAIAPTKVESVILSYQEKYLSERNMEDVSSLKNLLSEMIRKHAKELKEIEVDF